MKDLRILAVFVVWALLLFRVSRTVTDEGYYSNTGLIILALLAWLGGLAAGELIRYGIYRWRRIHG